LEPFFIMLHCELKNSCDFPCQTNQSMRATMSDERNERDISLEQYEEVIRLSAYYLWEWKGRKIGSDVEDWLEAEEWMKD
jgi:Protein of unknown function (DUF2934)